MCISDYPNSQSFSLYFTDYCQVCIAAPKSCNIWCADPIPSSHGSVVSPTDHMTTFQHTISHSLRGPTLRHLAWIFPCTEEDRHHPEHLYASPALLHKSLWLSHGLYMIYPNLRTSYCPSLLSNPVSHIVLSQPIHQRSLADPSLILSR